MAQVTITVRKDGPLRIEDPNGVIEMVDAEGNKFDLSREDCVLPLPLRSFG